VSTAEILEELPRLSASDRSQLFARLAEIHETDLLEGGAPSPAEKQALDEALAEFERDPIGPDVSRCGSCRDKTQFDLPAEGCSGFAKSGDGEGWVRGIQNSLEGGPAGFHPQGKLGLGDVFPFQDSLEFEGHHALEGEDLDFGADSFLREEVAKVAATVAVHLCFGFHFRCSFM
jgi:hypothetical protein